MDDVRKEQQRQEAARANKQMLANARRDGREFEGIVLTSTKVEFNGQAYPVYGAKALVEIGGTQRRTTATRVVVGSVITLGVGTVIGAMAKKKTNNVYLTVELADGQLIIVEAPAKREKAAREFAAKVTSAGVKEPPEPTRAASALAEAQQRLAERKGAKTEVLDARPLTSTCSTVDTPSTPPPPPTTPPAGWYPDPNAPGTQRYYDGSAWTEHTAPLTSPPPPPSA